MSIPVIQREISFKRAIVLRNRVSEDTPRIRHRRIRIFRKRICSKYRSTTREKSLVKGSERTISNVQYATKREEGRSPYWFFIPRSQRRVVRNFRARSELSRSCAHEQFRARRFSGPLDLFTRNSRPGIFDVVVKCFARFIEIDQRRPVTVLIRIESGYARFGGRYPSAIDLFAANGTRETTICSGAVTIVSRVENGFAPFGWLHIAMTAPRSCERQFFL